MNRIQIPFVVAALVLAVGVAGCRSTQPLDATLATGETPTPAAIEVTLLHLNDVYEITPVENGASGGLARVAALERELLAETPNTFTILAGDFFSPSALGTARVEGDRLAGRQMVASLNAMGLDYATFGNHEFDVNEDQFHDRLSESAFEWFSGNVFDAAGRPFPNVDPYELMTVKNAAGDSLRLALLGVTVAATDKAWVTYTDPTGAMREQMRALAGKVDVFIAVTHLQVDDDIALVKAIPEIDLVIGGHEHENMLLRRGGDLTPIAKADANARSVYIHRLTYNTETDALNISSEFHPITDVIPEDEETAAVVAEWVERGFEGFRADGFEPEEPVATVTDPLDGLESSVRNQETTLTRLIAEGMRHEDPSAELAIYNSGSIRIDDVVPPGVVTEYDVIRILPFGGAVVTVDMKGSLLRRILMAGKENAGSGGFLHVAGLDPSFDGLYAVEGRGPLEPDEIYRIVVNDYLLTGLETNLDFLTRNHPDLEVIRENRDIRKTLIDELKRAY